MDAAEDAARVALEQTRAQQPDHEAFDHDRAHDLLARGAERPQHPELARALRDGDREGVEDEEAADQQGDPTEHEKDDSEEAELVLDVLRLPRRGLRAGLHDDPRRQHSVEAAARPDGVTAAPPIRPTPTSPSVSPA